MGDITIDPSSPSGREAAMNARILLDSLLEATTDAGTNYRAVEPTLTRVVAEVVAGVQFRSEGDAARAHGQIAAHLVTLAFAAQVALGIASRAISDMTGEEATVRQVFLQLCAELADRNVGW